MNKLKAARLFGRPFKLNPLGLPVSAMIVPVLVIYSGLNLNQDKATKPQTVQIVRQGEATPYWFKVNPLYQGGCLSRTLYRYAALNIGFQEYIL